MLSKQVLDWSMMRFHDVVASLLIYILWTPYLDPNIRYICIVVIGSCNQLNPLAPVIGLICNMVCFGLIHKGIPCLRPFVFQWCSTLWRSAFLLSSDFHLDFCTMSGAVRACIFPLKGSCLLLAFACVALCQYTCLDESWMVWPLPNDLVNLSVPLSVVYP